MTAPVQNKVVNQYKDLVERVVWTFLQVELSLGALDQVSSGINLSTLHVLYAGLGAAVAATVKVFIAQRAGRNNDGAAIPGGVLK